MSLRRLVSFLVCLALARSAHGQAGAPSSDVLTAPPRVSIGGQDAAEPSLRLGRLDAEIARVQMARAKVRIWRPVTVAVTSSAVASAGALAAAGYALRYRARDGDGWDPTPAEEHRRDVVVRTSAGVAAVGVVGLVAALAWLRPLRAEHNRYAPYLKSLIAQRREVVAELGASVGPAGAMVSLRGQF